MGSLSSVKAPQQPISSVAPAKPAATPSSPVAQKSEQSSMQQDIVAWKDIPKSDRVKTAIATTFKKTILPYTIGGALAAPAAGAVLGGFVGLFNGQPGKGALEGAKFMARYMPLTAAAGAAVSATDAAVMGTMVGTAPDKQAAMTRVGGLTAIVGILTAEDNWDLLGTGVATVAESARAGEVFDRTNEALQKK